jgi:beta-lactamase superfamily II metal-dependent hydrolase
MKRKKCLPLVLVAVLILVPTAVIQAATNTLDIYFIDTEGGAATLIVTPSGESLLVDSGFPGERDAGRIAHVALDVAGLKQIDHYITTHFHRDHLGGIPQLVKLIPVMHFYDHGLPATPAADVQSEFFEAYRKTVQGKSVTLKPGDLLGIRPSPKQLPPLQIRVLASNGIVLGEQPGAAQIKPCGADFTPQPEDKSDNANSVGFLLTFGKFQFFVGGDLTWNIEDRLVCPNNLIGAIDVYQVDHHGTDSSNNPALIHAVKPRVAIIGSGPTKGAETKTFATLKGTPEIEAIYQIHRNVRTTEKENAPPAFVANDNAECKGEFIKLSVNSDGKSYSVSIPAKNITRNYKTR